MSRTIKNVPASVSTRLQQYARATNRSYYEVSHYYIIQCFLSRLSQSQYCKSLILKGGLAFFGWQVPLRRPTKDIDFQAYMSNSQTDVQKVVTEICSIPMEADGVSFDTTSIKAQTIMANTDYEGVRIRLNANLGPSILPLQIDISFANVITPKEIVINYPTLLDAPGFELRCYNQETAIAEKFQSMVFLGGFNDRLKDFYDIYLLTRECNFEGSVLVEAFIATFEHRKTAISMETPAALQNDFAIAKQSSWAALLQRTNLHGTGIDSFETVIEALRKFLLPPMQAAAKRTAFQLRWLAGDDWRPT